MPATPVRMESAKMASMSTNVCVPLDTQVSLCSVPEYIANNDQHGLMQSVPFSFSHFLHLINPPTGEQCDVNINECNSNPCMSGGTCVDKVNGFHCLCPPGTYGPLCLSGTDHCASQPCVNGDCIEQQHGYEKPLTPGLQWLKSLSASFAHKNISNTQRFKLKFNLLLCFLISLLLLLNHVLPLHIINLVIKMCIWK